MIVDSSPLFISHGSKLIYEIEKAYVGFLNKSLDMIFSLPRREGLREGGNRCFFDTFITPSFILTPQGGGKMWKGPRNDRR